MTAVERLIATAESQVGYLEKRSNSQLEDFTANAGYNNWNKYAAFLDNLGNVYNGKKNGYDWCDVFVDYCFIYTFGLDIGHKMIYQALKGLGAGCGYSMRYYKNNNAFSKTPKAGDQIFFSNDGGSSSYHTGIVYKVDNTYVYTIEGNTSSGSSVVANGGCVAKKKYKLNASYIGGYGHPNWDLVKEEEQEMEFTQDKFNEMFNVAMAAYLAEKQDNDAASWSADARAWATGEAGIVKGVGDMEDGTPNYAWPSSVTREELVTMLYRAKVNKVFVEETKTSTVIKPSDIGEGPTPLVK